MAVFARLADATKAGADRGASILRDTTASILDFDDFGNALVSDVATLGVDLTQHIERTYKNDIDN